MAINKKGNGYFIMKQDSGLFPSYKEALRELENREAKNETGDKYVFMVIHEAGTDTR